MKISELITSLKKWQNTVGDARIMIKKDDSLINTPT